MKKGLWLMAALPFMAFQCDRNQSKGHYLEGKMIRITCASKVIQVLNTDTVGENGWKNTMDSGTVYDHVFKASNLCEIPASVKEGDTFYFRIAPPAVDTCIVCMMYDAPPSVSYRVEQIRMDAKE